MTLIASDTFTGTNGTAPVGWTIAGPGTAVINNNRLRLTGNAAAQYGSVQVLRNTPTVNDDVDLTVTFEMMTASTNAQYVYLYLHADGVWAFEGQPQNGYQLELAAGISGQPDITLQKVVNGAATTLLSSPDNSVTFTGIRKFRIQAFRSTGVLRYRTWASGSTEPTTWLGSATDSTPLPAGRVGLGVYNGPNSTLRPIEFDDVTIDDNGTTVSPEVPVAPTSPRLIERWTGSALVAQRVDRWDGATAVKQTIDSFLVWDTFNRTSTVSAGAALTGQLWQAAAGSTWGTDGSTLYNVPKADGQFISLDTGSRLQDLTVTLAAGAFTAGAFPDIVMANGDVDTPYGYWIEFQPNGAMRLFVPFSTPDVTVTGVITSTAAQVIRVRVEPVTLPAPANRITIWVNGAQKYTGDDTASNRNTGTRIGFRHAQAGAATTQKWDNLTVRTT